MLKEFLELADIDLPAVTHTATENSVLTACVFLCFENSTDLPYAYVTSCFENVSCFCVKVFF